MAERISCTEDGQQFLFSHCEWCGLSAVLRPFHIDGICTECADSEYEGEPPRCCECGSFAPNYCDLCDGDFCRFCDYEEHYCYDSELEDEYDDEDDDD